MVREENLRDDGKEDWTFEEVLLDDDMKAEVECVDSVLDVVEMIFRLLGIIPDVCEDASFLLDCEISAVDGCCEVFRIVEIVGSSVLFVFI